MTATETPTAPTEPPIVSGDDGGTGHLEELRRDPLGLMARTRAECGDAGRFRLAGEEVVLLTGPEANEAFFRAPDEDLDQAAAYPFMTPIFGEGVVFDAPPERRKEMLHNQALRDKFMRGHAETIAGEVERMVAGWGDEGEIDLLDWFAELTIYTSSACLVGHRFREQLDGRFAALYHDLEQGTDALAYVDPYAPASRASAVATRPASGSSPWCRRSWTAAPRRTRRPTTSATCSTCSCRSRRPTAPIASAPTRSPACSSP